MTRFFKATAFAAAAVAMVAAGSAQAQTAGIATSNPGSLFHNIGTAVANAANEAGLNTTVQPATSPNQFIPFVNSGGIEFGVSNLQEVNYAISGEAWWNGVKNPNLRVVAMLMPLKEAIFVRADSDIKTLADLKGKRMTDGYTAQNTILPQLDAVYATADMTRKDVSPVYVTSVVAGAQAFMANDSDGFIFAHGAGKVREADASVGGLRALPVADDSDEALAKARKHWPTAFFSKMKAGSSPGVLEDATYIAFPQVIFTHADVPDDVVYAMAKAIYEGKDVMAGTFKAFNAFNPADIKGDPGIAEFHPGALKFFKEAGLD
ncbi:TAXI family TRAP transporter solute-binding subunit [uncultured Roseibium sp.]|uniref:TAXI family TRAP transporter solute-binding subunit n=1 Tax=uncultured Roseibium sp. TaxID=1936171 RepID=UPI003216BA76